MASLPLSLSPVAASADKRRLAGLLATVLVHAALILAWQLARTPPPGQADEEGPVMQWMHLPPLAPRIGPAPAPAPPAAQELPPSRPGPARSVQAAPGRAIQPAATPAIVEAPAPPTREAAPDPGPAAEAPARPDAATIMENARRSVAAIDRALRKESKPLIVVPPDSPELRMRRGMEHAHAMAPPRIFEAPKVEELVNNTGDGARRTRVITGNRTYCITERSPATNVEMIEMHGKIRLTNCPTPEEPAKRQEWRTARD